MYWVGQNDSSVFKVKIKRHTFHFHQEFYFHHFIIFIKIGIFTVLFHYILLFFRQLHNSIFSKLLSFWAKNCSRYLLQSSREWKFFPLREFCKDQNKWMSEGAMSGKYSRWIRTSQSSCNSFCLVIREACALALFCWKSMCFLLTNSGWTLFVVCCLQLL